MKKLAYLVLAVALFSSCSALSNINWDAEKLTSAAGKAATAASITDDQIVQLCAQSIAQLDAQNTIDNGTYYKRMARLLKNVSVPGLNLNCKVYKKDEINAFASGDGSIRVYSGLMDVMSDNELMAIIGHEIGHVVHKDTKRAMKQAYLNSALVDAIGSAGNIGAVSSALMGNLAESYFNSQFSQKQEFAADEYGFEFSVNNGFSPYSMSDALNKLVSLNQSTPSKLQQMFSSHPDSALRAQKMRAKAESYVYTQENKGQ